MLFNPPLAKRAAPALRSIAIGVGIGFSKNFDCDPDSDSDFGGHPQNMSRRKDLLAIVYQYTLNFLCTTKSEDPKK